MATENEAPVILVAIDRDPNSLKFITAVLACEQLQILTATDLEDGLNLIKRRHPQIVLLDLIMPKINGMEVLERIVAYDPGTDVILLTGHYSTESAVEAIQKGACDYLTKPISVDKLRERVSKLVAEARHRQRTFRLDHELLETFQFEGIVGRSPLMLDVFAKIRRVAPHFRICLVTGLTGTGKELVARALHRLSPAASGPFVVCHCAAIVETLFESELFGYTKGAFTGATQDKIGVFEFAHGGTLLLDEIGDTPLVTQSKLLRVLQDQEVQRVGSPARRKVDVRVIAATNRNLETLVDEKLFRDDLYFRLSMVEIKLPPLSERKEDLHLLERYFIEQFSERYHKQIKGLTRRAQALLSRHSWPGNIRDLENALGHACMMAEGNILDVRDFPDRLRAPTPKGIGEEDESLSLEALQRRHALRVLERLGGNKARAAEVLGVSRTTLYRLLAEARSEQSGQTPLADS